MYCRKSDFLNYITVPDSVSLT